MDDKRDDAEPAFYWGPTGLITARTKVVVYLHIRKVLLSILGLKTDYHKSLL
jgi:hypothetical protein